MGLGDLFTINENREINLMTDPKSTSKRILIVEDSGIIASHLQNLITKLGYDVSAVVPSGEQALHMVNERSPDLVLMDIYLAGNLNGIETATQIRANFDIPVVYLTAYADDTLLQQAKITEPYGYLLKPIQDLGVQATIEMALYKHQMEKKLKESKEWRSTTVRSIGDAVIATDSKKIARPRQVEKHQWGVDGFIGKSDAIVKLFEDIHRLQAVDDTSVLSMGESGTGKELIARAIHLGGTRADGPFIPVNCSAIPHELAESEFFGHTKGAFTGASQGRKGFFELASGGTLFLDEIGDMPLLLQAKLLRVLESGLVRPVGDCREKSINVRVISATNSNLQNRIASGAFRRDLYFRLARFSIAVPSLRERQEDIPLLIEHFLAKFSRQTGLPIPHLSAEALETLIGYHFHGNVRELKNLIEYALIQSDGTGIEVKHLNLIGENILATVAGTSTRPHESEALMIKGALLETNGDVEAAAQRLGLSTDKISPFLNVLPGLVPPPPQPAVYQTLTKEKKCLFDYVRQNGSINNTECRQLLNIPRHRAFYLLKQMRNAGVFIRKGTIRATRYYLPPSESN
jgi:DNA-binding NtrC family response regulator